MHRQLDHENIVGFIGACTDPANFCIITEYCARGSLVDNILSKKVSSPEKLCFVHTLPVCFCWFSCVEEVEQTAKTAHS